MQIQEAVETCVTQKYADFNSCATRSEFWWFVLFICVINGVLGFVAEWAAGIFGLAMLVPYFAVGTRRLRDTGRSPWWWALLALPVVGWITLTVFFAQLGKTPPTPT
jgi:uncharacterized membrane protein YhaH (DUF805 family)